VNGRVARADAGGRARGRWTILLAALSVLVTVGGVGAIGTTQAAWTDRTYASAVATAGTWPTATTNTCTAYTMQNTVIPGCVVTSIETQGPGWGDPGNQTRNYYLNFSGTGGAYYVTFDVTLPSTVSGVTWTWTNAGIATGGQFTAAAGWTCGQLPRILGRSVNWQVGTVWFQAYENRTGKSVACP